MIEFVLSRVPLSLLSFYPFPVSVNQIIFLPCQHTLLVEQSKLICKCALLFFFLLPLLSVPPSASASFPVLTDLHKSPRRRVVFSLSFFLIQKERTVSLLTWFSWQTKGAWFSYCTSFDEMMNPVSSR